MKFRSIIALGVVGLIAVGLFFTLIFQEAPNTNEVPKINSTPPPEHRSNATPTMQYSGKIQAEATLMAPAVVTDGMNLPGMERDKKIKEGMIPIGTSGLLYRILNINTVIIYSEYAHKTWEQTIPDAQSLRVISAPEQSGGYVSFLQTSSELYTVYHDREGPVLRKAADIPNTPARVIDNSFIVVGGAVYANDGTRQEVHDPTTFSLFSTDKYTTYDKTYYRDSRTVYGVRSTKTEMRSALQLYILPYDVSTFTALFNSDYTKDIQGVYFNKNIIKDADPKTFSVIGTPTLHEGKDSLIRYPYAKDALHVYYNGEVVADADPVTFQAIAEKSGTITHPYGYDARAVYYHADEIKGADRSTFEVLWWHIYEGCAADTYAKDAHGVYFEAIKLEGADSETFEATPVHYGKDKNGFWDKQFPAPSITETPRCNYG